MIRRYKNQRKKRQARIRAKVQGTALRPRLSVFRSNKYIYAQLIDDEKGKTIVAFGDLNEKLKMKNACQGRVRLWRKKLKKTEIAKFVGQELAKRVIAEGITEVIFDRGGYKYHGRVKALAEGAREGGLKF